MSKALNSPALKLAFFIFHFSFFIAQGQDAAELNAKAAAYNNKAKFDSAIILQEKVVQLVKEKEGKSNNYLTCLNTLAAYYQNAEDYKKAVPAYEEVLELTEKNLGTEHLKYGVCLNVLGSLYNDLGMYDKALPLMEKAVNHAKRTLGIDNNVFLLRLSNLGNIYLSMGDYENALNCFNNVLELSEKIPSADQHIVYNTRIRISKVYKNTGETDKELQIMTDLLASVQKTKGKENSEYEFTETGLAMLYLRLNQYDKALTLAQEALEISARINSKDHIFYAMRLINLGKINRKKREFQTALDYYKRALVVYENIGLKNSTEYAGIQYDIGDLYVDGEQYERGEKYYYDAIDLTKNVKGIADPDYVDRVFSLANYMVRQKRTDEAVKLLLESKEAIEKTYGKFHNNYSLCTNTLALIYEKQGKEKDGMELIIESMTGRLMQINQNFFIQPEAEQDRYVRKMNSYFEIAFSYYWRNKEQDAAIAAYFYSLALMMKGIQTLSGVDIRKRLLNPGMMDTLTIDRWILLKKIIADQYNLPIAERREDLGQLEAEWRKINFPGEKLKLLFREGGLIYTPWSKAVSSLKNNDASIEFFNFQYHNGTKWSDSNMVAAIVTKNSFEKPVFLILCDSRSIDSLLNKNGTGDASFISGLYRNTKIVGDVPSSANGKKLNDLIWKPLEKYLSPGDHIYFSTSGILHQVAFAAIPYDDGNVLADRYSLSQLISTAEIKYTPDTNRLDSSSLLILSPETLDEAKAIEIIADSDNVKPYSFYGNEASEENYTKEVNEKDPGIIHLAARVFFFPDPKRKPRFDTDADSSFSNSLYRSGMIFSGEGINLHKPNDERDGYLTSYEAANAYLRNTKLVVVPDCDTKLGEIKASEGVFALQRAFKLAGSEYVLMSLWKAPDAQTTEFMTSFYTLYFQGKSIEESFLETQTQMRNKYKTEPYKWAAFVLVR